VSKVIFKNNKITVKKASSNGVDSYTHYSICEKYRYTLTRKWARTGGGLVAFLMLNPSTATELQNDPTVERCERRARAMGYDGFIILNLFAIRATDPKNMLSDDSPVGGCNDFFIQRAIDSGIPIVCAWGNHGAHLGRSSVVKSMLSGHGNVFYLKMNGSGEPAHPLYLKYSDGLKEWGL